MGPVAIERVGDAKGKPIDKDKVRTQRVYSHTIGAEMRELMHGVVTEGTGKNSAVTEWSAGKTGTTENYGDAWFVGFTDRYTAAVWVGYPDGVRSMSTEYHGGPVEGGTYPAEIWHDLMQAIIDIDNARHPGRQPDNSGEGTGGSGYDNGVPSGPAAPAPDQGNGGGNNGGGNGGGGQNGQQAPQRPPSPQQNQQPATPQGGGGGGGTGRGGGATPPGAQ
jgi:penicillin-binding protein 1A